ncbi:ankyrin repeat-containing protein BDA1-like [Abrus precatorius]|uniref:Ankyrin repeat-containing protein BDA1-like n=1 Tax=Abrus precatorius TaxID=3816 RepID=A0A8B8LKF3_ABRPR|nr:ankyrin repeat-containing protein BDA1-like [Abrus precatorius]
MNIMNNDKLNAAALEGDINLLYTLIQEDPHILNHNDSTPFIDTPLHIASSCGHLHFVTEIMRLKPSYAWKLNQQGLAPIHLALLHGHNPVVLRFVDINKDLVRVKGREGITPIHLVSQVGYVDLLVHFLLLCPDSIQDVNVRSETSLHIAVRNEQYEALQVLVGWLKINDEKSAMDFEETLLNWKDDVGNTILHVSVQTNNLQALQLLVETNIDFGAKNSENKTALDIAANEEIKSILERAGAKRDTPVTEHAPTFVHKLKSNITVLDRIIILIFRIRRDLTEDQRNAFLIVAALVATAAYQSALSPPGGVYQANGGDSSIKFMATAPRGNAGRSVMDGGDFLALSLLNTLAFLISTLVIFVLTPNGKMRKILFAPMFWFANCYLYSMSVISPNYASILVYYILLFLLNLLTLVVCFSFPVVYKRLWDPANRKVVTKNSMKRNNVW